MSVCIASTNPRRAVVSTVWGLSVMDIEEGWAHGSI